MLEAQATEREKQECSFRPILFTRPQGPRPGSANAALPSSSSDSEPSQGSARNIFDSLYERGRETSERKLAMAETAAASRSQEDLSGNGTSFQPLIPQRSNRLAERRRKKRFYGVAAPPPVTAPPPTTPAVDLRSVDGDDGYHSAREGGEELLSRRSSLETIPSPDHNPSGEELRLRLQEEVGPEIEEPSLERAAPTTTETTAAAEAAVPARQQGQEIVKLSVFEMLYEVYPPPPTPHTLSPEAQSPQDRKLLERSKEASVAKYSVRPSFRPDIGIARHRIVESNVDEFSQRSPPPLPSSHPPTPQAVRVSHLPEASPGGAGGQRENPFRGATPTEEQETSLGQHRDVESTVPPLCPPPPLTPLPGAGCKRMQSYI
jgi:hypothetical protein